MINKISEFNIRAYEWLGGLVIGLIGWIYFGQNKRIDKNTDQLVKHTSDIQENRHDVKDIKKYLETLLLNNKKVEEGNSLILNTLLKRFDSLEAKIDNKK